ncbi:YkgJ family cysteine cluster protein [Thermodesulfatator atlanticus]|uniref:YkgJ family cysteine cluster protein n=1 Tax=Thermodesulfatator atlanticus TaxID=501497 RepID=UPI0003B6D8E3|nr:YkgJ family cysteine cluster protein [Thermodesulfatator atlanticus]
MSVKIFECKRCGFCCQGESTVSLTPPEQESIAMFLGLNLSEFFERYTVKKGSRVEMKTINGHCIFFDEKEKICRIHPVKPSHCRRWPLHPSILKDRESFEIIKRTCPGFSPSATWEEVVDFIRYMGDTC